KSKTGEAIVVDYSVLIIEQRRKTHLKIAALLKKIEAGDGFQNGVNGLGGGGGKFGGGFFQVAPKSRIEKSKR
ncbi:MAG: hypothetical protein AAF623_22050, partial [Planctomycetota bacterium]